ncbi:MAG TPA: hypothetical protein VEB21_11595 [Terriglobales bacterium]|nr:hypothetical protein [Terriglobales bacterium]
MNLSKWLITLGVCLLTALPALGADQVLTGELVVLDGSSSRFRLVDHGGSFQAPGGVSLEAFDGKPVEVRLSGGRVVAIEEMPMHIAPVEHGYEVITGHLLVTSPSTFSIAGDSRSYRAPAHLELSRYANQMVQVRLDERGHVTELNFAGPAVRAADAPVISDSVCRYNGQTYSDGAPICQSGTQFRCERGEWRNLGLACAEPRSALDPGMAHRSRSCMFGGASVASGSSICRNGTTLRCADGEWININVPCS